MDRQLIICVEANKKSDSDRVYINEALSKWYTYNNETKISFINMGAKTKYNSREVENNINRLRKDYRQGESVVIICINTDKFESNFDHKKELDQISAYCIKHSYDLVWFCHEIEEVFLGDILSDHLKVKASADFRRKKLIKNVSENKLSAKRYEPGKSNILTILDKYLLRK